MISAEMSAWVAESRARQGLGPTITDLAVQEQFAAMAADALVRQACGDGTDEHAGGGSTAASRRPNRKASATAAKQKQEGADGS